MKLLAVCVVLQPTCFILPVDRALVSRLASLVSSRSSNRSISNVSTCLEASAVCLVTATLLPFQVDPSHMSRLDRLLILFRIPPVLLFCICCLRFISFLLLSLLLVVRLPVMSHTHHEDMSLHTHHEDMSLHDLPRYPMIR